METGERGGSPKCLESWEKAAPAHCGSCQHHGMMSFADLRENVGKREKGHTEHPGGLMVIAAFKLLKGLALLAVAFGALSLLHKDVAAIADRWVNLLKVDPHNRYILWLLEKLSKVDAKRLKQLSVGTFFYSGVFLTEGV